MTYISASKQPSRPWSNTITYLLSVATFIYYHGLTFVELVSAAVDDGDGEAALVPEEHHDGHGEEAIDLPGDGGEFPASVVAAFKLDGNEDVGFEEAALDGVVGEEAGLAAEFLIGELEEKVGGFPVGEESLGLIERVTGGEEVEKGLRR